MRVKGPLEFIIRSKNQKSEKAGLNLSPPLLIKILRECLCSYKILAPANMPEDTKPWANIIHQMPSSLVFSSLKRAAIIIDMCTTEE